MSRRHIRVICGLSAVSMLGWAGCASVPEPKERLTTSEGTIRAAQEKGAQEVPRAALYLQFARDQTAKARALIAEGENARADVVLQRAEADAEVALALAREAPAKEEAREAMKQVNSLRQGRP